MVPFFRKLFISAASLHHGLTKHNTPQDTIMTFCTSRILYLNISGHNPYHKQPKVCWETSSYIQVNVEGLDWFFKALYWHQHVLHNVVLLVQLPDGFPLGELQQRDFWGDHPAKQVTEHGVIAKRNDILQRGKEKSLAQECASGPKEHFRALRAILSQIFNEFNSWYFAEVLKHKLAN